MLWFYDAPGSAMWVNLGVTISFQTHGDAVRNVLRERNCRECLRHMKDTLWLLRQQGYDTVQFLANDDMSCGAMRPEIVHLRWNGSSCNKKYLRHGANASLPCNCLVQSNHLNCDGAVEDFSFDPYFECLHTDTSENIVQKVGGFMRPLAWTLSAPFVQGADLL